MSKQTLTVDLDVPEGFELTGEYRTAIHDEYYLIDNHLVGCCLINTRSDKYPILREAWKPPAWLPNGCWVYKFYDDWFVSTTEPQPFGVESYRSPSNFVMLELFRLFGGEFMPPPVNKIQVKH